MKADINRVELKAEEKLENSEELEKYVTICKNKSYLITLGGGINGNKTKFS
ncbi:hypothetical protein [Faecalimicrobium sp. JNUCC 81]